MPDIAISQDEFTYFTIIKRVVVRFPHKGHEQINGFACWLQNRESLFLAAAASPRS